MECGPSQGSTQSNSGSGIIERDVVYRKSQGVDLLGTEQLSDLEGYRPDVPLVSVLNPYQQRIHGAQNLDAKVVMSVDSRSVICRETPNTYQSIKILGKTV